MKLISFRPIEFQSMSSTVQTDICYASGTRWPALDEEKPVARIALVRQRPSPSAVATALAFVKRGGN